MALASSLTIADAESAVGRAFPRVPPGRPRRAALVVGACAMICVLLSPLLLRSRNPHSKDLRSFMAKTPPLDAAPAEAAKQATCRIISSDDRGAPPRSLTIVHTTVVRADEVHDHAKMFALSAPSWIVTGALVYAINGPRAESAAAEEEVVKMLSHYPHRRKRICWTPNNGYYCGQFADWHRLSSMWQTEGKYDLVLHVESDVYAMPLAIQTVEKAYNTFSSSHQRSGSGGGKSSKAFSIDSGAWLAAWFKDLKNVKDVGERGYNMDLLALAPPANLEGSAAASVWYDAYKYCETLPKPPWSHHPAERSLYHAVQQTNLPISILLNETWHGTRKPDPMGVWHTHDSPSVSTWLKGHAFRDAQFREDARTG